MEITGTLVNLYFVCHRELWLHAQGIRMEHTSDVVADGRLVHETSYAQRSDRFKEVELGPVRIDFFDFKNKVVHEVKRTAAMEEAHVWQLKYYLYLLECVGVEASGVLEYPRLRQKQEVWLSEPDRAELLVALKEIELIIASRVAPVLEKKSICRSCSYFDFCFCDEL